MLVDRYSGQHSTTSAKAVAAFEAAIVCVAAHRPAAGEHLKAALENDPHLVAAHALKGFAALLLARSEMLAPARQALLEARRSLMHKTPTQSELALTQALTEAVDGGMLAACAILERHICAHRHDFLAIKLVNGMRFMMGDLTGMLSATAAVVDDWSAANPGYGFVLGCHAFGLEEAGEFAAAERTGLAAVQHEPRDAWGLHAVSHVYEMNGRLAAGIGLLETARPMWTQCHNFSFHMAWHLALLQLERGQHEAALDIYDHDVRPVGTDDFRDIANAASLLWRLRQDRVDVGYRWQELAALAQSRTNDTTLVFASLHHLLSLIASGDFSCAEGIVAALQRRAAGGGCDQADVAALVGVDLAQAMLDFARKGASPADLGRLARNLPAIGGSHAQRDVFLRSLAGMAAEAGQGDTANNVLALRRRYKRDDKFAALVQKRLAALQPERNLRFAS